MNSLVSELTPAAALERGQHGALGVGENPCCTTDHALLLCSHLRLRGGGPRPVRVCRLLPGGGRAAASTADTALDSDARVRDTSPDGGRQTPLIIARRA